MVSYGTHQKMYILRILVFERTSGQNTEQYALNAKKFSKFLEYLFLKLPVKSSFTTLFSYLRKSFFTVVQTNENKLSLSSYLEKRQ